MKKRRLLPISERKRVTTAKRDEYVKTLSEMVNCKTVFSLDGANRAEYEKFYAVIDEKFPNIKRVAQKLTFGTGCFMYVIKGKNAKKNIMLMSHHDVVEAGEGWESDAFSATVRDGFLYGRGTIDTKTPLFAELQAVEELIAEGYDFNGINL